MILIKMIFAFLFPTLLGYILVELVVSKGGLLKPLEKLAVSYCMGVGILTFVMFLLGAFGLPISLPCIIIACSLIFIIPFVLVARNMTAPRFDAAAFLTKLKSLKWYEWFFACMIILRICFSYFSALIKPIGDVDAFANWSLRAKVFFVTQGLSLDKTHGYFVGSGHLYYPLNIPLFETWIYNVLGMWNDLLVKAIFPTFLLALVIIFYYSMRRVYNRPFSLFSAYLLTTLPLLIYHSSSAYADFPLCVYFSSSAFFLINYLESRNGKFLIVSAVMAGIGTWTKSEGLYLALICIAVLALGLMMQKKDSRFIIKESLVYALLGLMLKVSWSLFNILYRVPNDEAQKIEFSRAIEYLYRIPVIFERFYKRLFFYGNWNIAWFVCVVMMIVMLIFSVNKTPKLRQLYSLLICLLSLLAFVMLYYITPNYIWLLDGTTVNRNTLLIMPVVIYFISSGIGEVLEKGL